MSPERKREHDIFAVRVLDYTPDSYRGPVVLEKTGDQVLVVRVPPPKPNTQARPEGTES